LNFNHNNKIYIEQLPKKELLMNCFFKSLLKLNKLLRKEEFLSDLIIQTKRFTEVNHKTFKIQMNLAQLSNDSD
jgi:hypothetical protein